MRGGTNQDVALGPVHELSEPILNAETAARVGPGNVFEFVAHDPARATFNAAFVTEDHVAIIGRGIAIGRAAVNTLLAYALQTHVGIDDLDVRPVAVNVVIVESQFSLDRGWIKDCGPKICCHDGACFGQITSPGQGRMLGRV
jgi:hypothetical protein